MRSFLLFLTLAFSVPVFSQTTEDSVKQVVNDVFIAMKNADPAALRAAFADSAVLQTISVSKDGKTIVRNEAVAEFADFIGQQKKNSADERITFGIIRIDGALAIVWTPYEFYYDGKFIHCGVNSFQLVKFNNKWKIQYLIDTRRKEGCKPATP